MYSTIITGGNNFSATGNISTTNNSALSITTGAGSMSFSGTLSLQHLNLDLSGSLTFGSNVSVNNFITTASSSTFNSDLTVAGTISANFLTCNGVGATVALHQGGTLLGITSFSNITGLTLGSTDAAALTIVGSLTIPAGVATLNTQGSITTSGQITIPGALALTGSSSFDTGGGAGAGFSVTGNISTTPTANLTVNSGLGGTIFSGDVIVNGIVILTGATNMTGTNITFLQGGSITGNPTFGNTTTIIGNADSNRMQIIATAPVSITGGGGVTLRGSVETNSRALTFSAISLPGVLNLTTTLSGSGADVTLNSTVDGVGTLSINAGSGNTTFTGIVGGTTPPSSVTVQANQININANQSAFGSSLVYDGILLATSTITLTDTGAGIRFLGAVGGDTIDTHTLNLTAAAGSIIFEQGTLSGVNRLAAIVVSDVELLQSLDTIHAVAFTYNQIADTGNVFLTALNTTGASATAGGNVTIATRGSITLTGDLTAVGGVAVANGQSGGTVNIQSVDSDVIVKGVNTSGSDGNNILADNGGNAGTITIQANANSSVGNIPLGQIALYGDLLAQGGQGFVPGVGNNISLAATGRTAPLLTSTIHSNPSGGDVAINASSLTIGLNESITVLGTFTINATSISTLGDVVTLDDLIINAPTINVDRHLSTPILASNGSKYKNPNTHFLAGGALSLSSTPAFSGAGPTASLTGLNLQGTSQRFFKNALMTRSFTLNMNVDTPNNPARTVLALYTALS